MILSDLFNNDGERRVPDGFWLLVVVAVLWYVVCDGEIACRIWHIEFEYPMVTMSAALCVLFLVYSVWCVFRESPWWVLTLGVIGTLLSIYYFNYFLDLYQWH